MAWRLAKSLERLRAQANATWPNRSKKSDGTIGDEAHASRSSDHNPWIKDGKDGVVSGMDLTHDPAGGLDIQKLADALVASRDARIKYLICNGRIVSGSGQKTPAWQWRPYTDKNKHNHHIHISVKSSKPLYDDTKDWSLGVVDVLKDKPITDKKLIAEVQEELWNLGFTEVGSRRPDGTFDGVPGKLTEAAVMAFRNERGLPPSPVIDDALVAQLGRAKIEEWKRTIPAARANANTATVVEKVPEAKSANVIKRASAAVGTGAAALLGGDVAGNVGIAKSYIGQVQEYFSDIPGWAWFLLVIAIAAFIGFKAHGGLKSMKEAWQTGARR